jgi:hypothetical protein
MRCKELIDRKLSLLVDEVQRTHWPKDIPSGQWGAWPEGISSNQVGTSPKPPNPCMRGGLGSQLLNNRRKKNGRTFADVPWEFVDWIVLDLC